jgi:hypothetical protein
MQATVTYRMFTDETEEVSAVLEGDTREGILESATKQMRLAFYSAVTIYMMAKRTLYSDTAEMLYSVTTHYLPCRIQFDDATEEEEILCDISPAKVGEAVLASFTDEQKEKALNHDCDNPDCPIDDLCTYLGIPGPARDAGR